jgi:hypothetical protein
MASGGGGGAAGRIRINTLNDAGLTQSGTVSPYDGFGFSHGAITQQ